MKYCYKWGQKLQDYGFRLTASREVILKVVTNTDKHLSAGDVLFDTFSGAEILITNFKKYNIIWFDYWVCFFS